MRPLRNQCGTAILGLLVLSGVALVAGPAGGQPFPGTVVGLTTPSPDREVAFYFNGSDSIPIVIALDRLGIIVRQGISDSTVKTFTDSLSLVSAGTFAPRLFTFSIHDTLSRSGLAGVVRRLRQVRPDIISRVGLQAALPGHVEPILITDEFVVQFRPGVTRHQVDSLGLIADVRIVTGNLSVPNQFLLETRRTSRFDGLSASVWYQRTGLAIFSVPNFVRAHSPRQGFIPNDPLFQYQWHHRNAEQKNAQGAGGTPDADLDTPEAWEILRKLTSYTPPIIAVIDWGFDVTNEDLAPALWKNPGEPDCATGCNGLDDDRNGFVDDYHGWSFHECSEDVEVICGDTGLTPVGPGRTQDELHGTAVAGLAGAATDNGLGIAGTCPGAKLMLIRRGDDDLSAVRAIDYAWSGRSISTTPGQLADVIVCSWGYPATVLLSDALARAATLGRQGMGCATFFAMSGDAVNDCDGLTPDVSSLDTVIGVSASDNDDRKLATAANGPCVDVLAPAQGPALSVVTTDWSADEGYNALHHSQLSTCSQPAAIRSGDIATFATNVWDFSNQGYTACFTGTSASAPLAGGVGALVLAANPKLTRAQVQQLLQDTADKVSPSSGAYELRTGYSAPASGDPTHGYGRVNAFEAIRVVAPVSAGGRDGVDLFIRDNELDWGNTEQPSMTLFDSPRLTMANPQSPDIKVDADPISNTPPADGVTFDLLSDEVPKNGKQVRVHVRVRNRGPVDATSTKVMLLLAQVSASAPGLPSDFWSQFPNNLSPAGEWTIVGTKTIITPPSGTVRYSGCSAARQSREESPTETVPDEAGLVWFDFTWPMKTLNGSNHFVLFAIADSDQDHPSPRTSPSSDDLAPAQLVPKDNNLARRDVQL